MTEARAEIAVVDPHLMAAIVRAVDAVAAGRITSETAVAAIARTVAATQIERTAAERIADEGARLLELYDAAGGDGCREAAGRVARSLAPGDPYAQATIADRIRRLARKRRERSHETDTVGIRPSKQPKGEA